MVDEENALQMIHLMLEADGEEAVQLFLMRLALFVEPTGADVVGAVDFGILIGDRETALAVGLESVGGPDNLRIDEDAGIADVIAALLLRLLQVDDEQTLRNGDLGRRQSAAGGGINVVENVRHQPAYTVIHHFHWHRNMPKQRLRSIDDRKQGH